MRRKIAGLLSATLAAGLLFSTSITSLAAPKISPYNSYEAEKAVTKVGVEVATEGSVSFIKGLESGDSFSTVPFAFENGAKSLSVSVRTSGASWVDIHVDKVDGEKIGSLRLNNTNGEFKAFTANVSNVEGSHTLYFVGKRGNVDVDNFVTTPAEQIVDPQPAEPEPVVEPVAASVNPYDLVQSETATDKKLAAEMTKDGITHLNIRNGGYAAYKNVDFSKGIAALTVTCASNKIAVLEVRVDSLDGTVLSNVKLNGSSFAEKTVKVSTSLEGTHDLYFVPATKGTSVMIDSWKAMSAPVKPEPVNPEPVDPEPVDPQPVDPTPVDPTPVDPVVVTGSAELEYQINSWGTGYTINLKIANNTDNAINGWTLKLKKNEIHIDSSWCANVTEDGEYYVFTPMSWNTTIQAHGDVQLGLVGSGSIGTTISYILQ